MKRVNHVTILLELYPDKPWDYGWLSDNPNITWEIVQNHPDKEWSYWRLSRNKFERDAVVWRRKQTTHGKIREKIPLPRDLAVVVADYAI